MISSMTGYGRGEQAVEGRNYVVEIRTENNRYLDVSVRVPKLLAPLEKEVKQCVQNRIFRGRVLVTITLDSNGEDDLSFSLNTELATSYHAILKELQVLLSLSGDISIDVLTRLPDLITFTSPEKDIDTEWNRIRPALEEALDNLLSMRHSEGTQLQKDMAWRIDFLDERIREIEDLAPFSVSEAKKRMDERLRTLLDIEHVDPLRLAIEAGVLADRCDITEECVRFHSHNELFRETLRNESPVGKRLGFILQEMNREAKPSAQRQLIPEFPISSSG